MEFKDYYKTLGVDEDADADDIKRAYRRLARKYHPDVSRESDAEVHFKEVNEAYEALKDPEKRQAYDEIRRSPFRNGGQFEPPPGWQFKADLADGGFTSGADADAFSDFFRTLFGDEMPFGGARPGGRPFSGRGQDVADQLDVTLEEACNGGYRRLQLAVPQRQADGRITRQSRVLNVRIPPGVTDGRRIRLRGQGGTGVGDGPAGDLLLEIRIAPHSIYGLDGRDVTLSLPVAPWEAALGGTVKTPTLKGEVDLRIPAGSGTGTKLRLRGRGLPGSPPGDQIVALQVETPVPTTEKQKELYRRMACSFDFNPRRKLGGGTAHQG